MARWYSTFDNSTVAALEQNGSRYKRQAMSGGASLRTALLSARQALSDAALATVDPANRDGSLGIVVPADVATIGGGNVSWANLYTNTGAVWPSNPAVRPLAQILAAGSTPVSPTDAGSVSQSLYEAASAALENVVSAIAGGGPRARLGLDPYKTLASFHHDHAMSYVAWDDFTPGQPQAFSANTSNGFAANPVNITFSWTANPFTAFQFPWDEGATASISAQIQRQLGGPNPTFDINVDAIDGAVIWTIAGGALTPGTYDIISTIRFFDPTVVTHGGPLASFSQTGFLILS